MKWNLPEAVVVINYKHYEDDNFHHLRKRKIERCIIDSPLDWGEWTPLECYVELLTDKKPMEGLEWEKVEYRYCHLDTFTLERNCFHSIKEHKRLENILNGYGVCI